MNKKIYYNGAFILLSSDDIQQSGNQLIVDAGNISEKDLKLQIEKFIQQKNKQDLIFVSKDINSLFKEIKKQFIYIEAAGGLIEQNKRYLFIYRLKKWDLPKGKIDKGENPPQAALRECEEECGISDLEIIKELAPSYHVYPYKTGFALKTTYWFLMKTDFSGKLIPQTSEYIEKAEWLNKDEIKQIVMPNTYPSVSDLILDNVPIKN
jgi:8-oxo-dGTP pyrophosphatase MutT (NUDIX family)